MGRLLRGMARTAVVAGTATAVSNRVSRRQGERWAQQDAGQQQQYAPPQPTVVYAPAPPAAAEPAASSTDRIAALQGLAELKQSGVLTEAEFEREKARILGS